MSDKKVSAVGQGIPDRWDRKGDQRREVKREEREGYKTNLES